MQDTALHSDRAKRRALCATSAIYVAISVALVAFATHVFGSRLAFGLSLALMVPLVAAFNAYRKARPIQGRDIIVMYSLYLGTLAATAGVIWNWYDTGMAQEHIEALEFKRFSKRLRADARFDNVCLTVQPKRSIKISGAVSAEADLRDLRALASQYDMHWGDEVVVAPRRETSGKGKGK